MDIRLIAHRLVRAEIYPTDRGIQEAATEALRHLRAMPATPQQCVERYLTAHRETRAHPMDVDALECLTRAAEDMKAW